MNYGTGDPQSLGSVEWMSYRFSELNEDDLFWYDQNVDGDKNPPFRKIDDTRALNLRKQELVSVNPTLTVHQKEY